MTWLSLPPACLPEQQMHVSSAWLQRMRFELLRLGSLMMDDEADG
jgi:hypothetical protein